MQKSWKVGFILYLCLFCGVPLDTNNNLHFTMSFYLLCFIIYLPKDIKWRNDSYSFSKYMLQLCYFSWLLKKINISKHFTVYEARRCIYNHFPIRDNSHTFNIPYHIGLQGVKHVSEHNILYIYRWIMIHMYWEIWFKQTLFKVRQIR